MLICFHIITDEKVDLYNWQSAPVYNKLSLHNLTYKYGNLY